MGRLKVKVVPGASTTAIVGWLGDTLKLRVTAPPEKGQANKAVIGLIASSLGVSERGVRIVAGHTSARKTLEVEGLPVADLRRRLAALVKARDTGQQ
ncbi:MAG: DUF167 domain-containing protein [Gammaproteobacteria bacterium]